MVTLRLLASWWYAMMILGLCVTEFDGVLPFPEGWCGIAPPLSVRDGCQQAAGQDGWF